jgi:hypothetical protein
MINIIINIIIIIIITKVVRIISYIMKLTAAVLSGTSSPFVENIHAPFNLGTHYQHGRASPNEMNHAWNTKDNMFILAALGTDRSDWLKLANNRQYVSSVCSAIPSICQKFPDKSVEFISEHIRRLAEHRFRREWTSDDDDLLRTLHLQHSNSLSYWGVIGVELKRGKDQCRNRWTQIKKTGASMIVFKCYKVGLGLLSRTERTEQVQG